VCCEQADLVNADDGLVPIAADAVHEKFTGRKIRGTPGPLERQVIAA
jgi:hypothetical protein